MNALLCNPAQVLCMANDNDALIPEVWSREALAVLMSNMVMANLVHRDFNEMIAEQGDVVNVSRPSDFKGKRKTDSDTITDQDAISPNIRVPLDQHLYVSFIIKDGEMSKALPNLVERYLEPAARELAEKVDQALCGQAARLVSNTAGRLLEMDKTNASDFILSAEKQLNVNRVPKFGRNLVLTPDSDFHAKGAELFVSAEKRGDEGTALREASLGRVYGFDTFMDQNASFIELSDADTSTGVTDGAEAKGDTVIETTVTFSDVTAGDYVVIEGEGFPHRVSSVADDGGDADITLTEGLKNAVASGADVTVFKSAAVNESGGYAAGYSKEISIDGHASDKNIQTGQWITFDTGASSHSYTVIEATVVSSTETDVLLDRPLDASIANNDAAFVGPAGSFNLAFTRDSIAFVNRPLATVPEGSGARSFVASFNGISMRVTMQYDRDKQGMGVTFDLLMGVAILDERQAVVVLG